MLTDNQIKQITKLLNLEKITVIQRMSLIIFPKEINDEFHKNFNEVQIKLKKISPLIDINICSDAVIEEIKLLQAPETIEKEIT